MWNLEVASLTVLVTGFMFASAAALHRQSLVRRLRWLSMQVAIDAGAELQELIARLKRRCAALGVVIVAAVALTVALELLLPRLFAL